MRKIQALILRSLITALALSASTALAQDGAPAAKPEAPAAKGAKNDAAPPAAQKKPEQKPAPSAKAKPAEAAKPDAAAPPAANDTATDSAKNKAKDAGDAAPPAADENPALPTETPAVTPNDTASKPGDDQPMTDEGTTTPPAIEDGASSQPAASVDTPIDGDYEKLKAQLKEELKAELKQQLQSDLEAAARDAASQRAAKLEWEEEPWVEEVKPKLNFLEISGYFRTRLDFFHNLSLGTFDPTFPGGGRGTSTAPTPTLYRPFDGNPGCVDNEFEGTVCEQDPEDTTNLITANMRLRLEPTLNVSEDIRIRSTLDIFDNMVLGSTPESKPGFVNNPTLPLPLFASSQNPPQAGLNTIWDPIRVRRLWAEVMTPFGQLRVGRQPQNWGLGLLVNDGNGIDQDFGDQADQIMFATRIAGHYIVPAYSISSAGPTGRGGGAGVGGDNGIGFNPNEQGQRYNLDWRDDVHTFILTLAKKDRPEDIEERLKTGWPVFNYGVFGAYRRQDYDVPTWYNATDPTTPANVGQYVRRNANAGIASFWLLFQWQKFKFEAEAVGIVGHIASTATLGTTSINDVDAALAHASGDPVPLWIIQGGAAFEASYSLLDDSLVIGFDGGVASGDDAPGFGLRSTLNQNPRQGDVDGKQYGECLEYNADGECENVDNNITNFRFDPSHNVDMLLYREVMGTVTDSWYVKPHVSYYLTEDIGFRGDLIYSQAIFANSTPGQYLPMGVEANAKGFYRSDDGFFVMLQGGVLLPLGAFNHARDPGSPLVGKDWRDPGSTEPVRVNDQFLNAQFAYTLQAFCGVQF